MPLQSGAPLSDPQVRGERGDIGLVGETGETAVRQIMGALLSKRNQGPGNQTSPCASKRSTLEWAAGAAS